MIIGPPPKFHGTWDILPTIAGIATWPRRLPLSRTPTAVPRMLSGAVCAIQIKLSGMPSLKPATTMNTNSTGTESRRVRGARTRAGSVVLKMRSLPRPTAWVIGRRKSRDVIDAPARAARRSPTVVADSPAATPYAGR